MALLKTAVVSGVLIAAISGIAAPVGSAVSANVVCNRWGDCWHVRDQLAYPAGVGMTFHSDAWGFAHRTGPWRWRSDGFDRGAYRNVVWIAF